MKIAYGCDHAGFELKETLVKEVRALGHDLVDCGAFAYESTDDYPDFARVVGQAIQQGRAERGIVVCGSGIGAAITANKLRGIRACVCHDVYSARQGVTHDDMNVLCIGGRVVGIETAKELIRAFLSVKFSNEERHVRRLNKVIQIESENRKG